MKSQIGIKIGIADLQVHLKTWQETALRSVQDDATRSDPDRAA